MSQIFGDETIIARIGHLEGLEEKEPAIDILGGPAMGRQVILKEGETIWGRGNTADIIIEDEGISRSHFKITVKDKIATLEDLNSTNGTYINGKAVNRYVLEPTDKIQISSATVLRFSYVDPLDTDMHRRIFEMALYDPVTQAHTKRFLNDRLIHEFKHSLRKQHPLTLIIFDLDYFKKVNDTYGHPAGDYVLPKVAEISKAIIRKDDIFARYGGEEFVVLMRDSSEQEGVSMAERLRGAVQKTDFRFENKLIPVTISLGIATLTSQNFVSPEALLKAADRCLYFSKEHGRNRFTAFSALEKLNKREVMFLTIKKFRLLIFALIALPLVCLHGCTKDYVTGKSSYNWYRESEDVKLGSQVLLDQMNTLQDENAQIDVDTEQVRRVSQIVDRIAKVSHRPDYPYEAHVAEVPVVNAWAAPGGKIMVYSGLYDPEKGLVSRENDDEIAAVLGHEIAHATARHVTEYIP